MSEELDKQLIKPIDKWDGSAVKNHLDDAVKMLFTQNYRYTENFILIDIRLGISLVAVGVAVAALIFDFLNPFPLSKQMLLFCVLAYFVLIALLTLYTTIVEKGIFLKAKQGDKSLTVSSYNKRFDDMYQLCLELSIKGGNKAEVKFENSFAKWFDEAGYFLEDKFEKDVKKLYQELLGKKCN